MFWPSRLPLRYEILRLFLVLVAKVSGGKPSYGYLTPARDVDRPTDVAQQAAVGYGSPWSRPGFFNSPMSAAVADPSQLSGGSADAAFLVDSYTFEHPPWVQDLVDRGFMFNVDPQLDPWWLEFLAVNQTQSAGDMQEQVDLTRPDLFPLLFGALPRHPSAPAPRTDGAVPIGYRFNEDPDELGYWREPIYADEG